RDVIPIHVTDSVVAGEVTPTYPVLQYSHDRRTGGDAIANGFFYRGSEVPALRGKLLFGDITTGRLWFATREDIFAADDGVPTTLAPIHEVQSDLRRLVERTYRERGGMGDTLPGAGAVAGDGRVDLRFAEDSTGE